ncbi:MAG: hypothetical protein WAW06_05555 [bacterium]
MNDGGRLESEGRKLCPKIILEGSRLTLKTEIAFALNEHPRIVGRRAYRYHSPLISGEWCGFTNKPWGRGVINFLPDEEGELALETYRAWVHLFELLKYYSWIVDRFHLSTRMYQKMVHGRDFDFAWLEDRLVRLGFRIVFCTRKPETFEAALTERLKVSGNPSQYRGVAEFIEEQEMMRGLVATSRIQSLEVDVSGGDLGAITGRIANWLEETGGLWLEGDRVAPAARA